MRKITEEFLALLAPYAKQLNFEILHLEDGAVTVDIPENPDLIRDIGVVCGQSIMSAADSLGPICVISRTKEHRDMTTLNMQTHFLSPIPAGAFTAKLRLIRMGKKISVVNAEFFSNKKPDKLCAMATITYSFL